jgi:hypothetical protein
MRQSKYYILFILIGIFYYSCQNTQKNRIVEEYYPGGTIKSEIAMTDTMRNGLAKYYSETGHLLSTAEYKNDKREGWVINYITENGKIATKAFYKNDLQDGQVFQYYKEGMLFRESTYVKGRVDGIIKTYWPDGKLKAENTFKMGKPAIGLKEYDKEGKLIKQPVIQITEINQAALLNKVIVKFSISDGNTDVDFYLDNLEDAKYFNPQAFKLRNDEGVSSIEYPVHHGTKLFNKISIVAKVKTSYGNTLILQKYYNLNISN